MRIEHPEKVDCALSRDANVSQLHGGTSGILPSTAARIRAMTIWLHRAIPGVSSLARA
jgi:hypothetical protein